MYKTFIDEISQIETSNLSVRNKYLRLKQVLERSCKEITESESLQFPSLFSRIVFIAQKYGLPKQLEWQLQNIRVKANFLHADENNLVSAKQYEKAKHSIGLYLKFIGGDGTVRFENLDPLPEDETKPFSLDKIRVQVLQIDHEKAILICKSEGYAEGELKVKYGVKSINDIFNSTIGRLWIGAQLNLIDCKLTEDGFFIPGMIVLEPDYLIDASAMAECFQNYGDSHLHYFRRKFEQAANTHFILLGNLANFFLDELVYAENAEALTFEETFAKSFRQIPFEYASCKEINNNDAFKAFMAKAYLHFENIKRVVLNDMPANQFEVGKCSLEPSFFSEKYGFQGRLDLLQLADDKGGTDRIIELKSGKPPFPQDDASKIASNHEAQTVIYRLMIQSVFDKDSRHVYPTILYSSTPNKGENLRLAAAYKQLEKEIINTRNLIVATEHDLYVGEENAVVMVFEDLFDMDNYGRVPQFFVDKLESIQKIIDKASELERAYFYRYISFVTRELYLQKMGDEGLDSSTSTSSLWNTSFEERLSALESLSNLELEEIEESERDMKIRFRRPTTESFANFREGDICILYPKEREEDTVLTKQILKGTVIEISTNHMLLRFRYRQKNRSYFERHTLWAVEHDRLDHSYNGMYKSLFAFLTSKQNKRDLLLGLQRPLSASGEFVANELSKEDKQEIVIQKAIATKDYFLIVGPPGTGKTSIFARRLIEEFYKNDGVNILVMAYTNRAVDELCAAIAKAFGEGESECEKYIRIGSEYSCGEAFRPRLLQHIAHKAKSRKELNEQVNNARIMVGTLASINGRPELFELKKFNVAIIDEASQILEPQIIGLLPLFDKFIMIGDHKQLSTITLQNESKSKNENATLHSIGLYDCRESLFERLFRICQVNDWNNAYDTLTYHGRMHEEISSFVNFHFYDNQLCIATERQSAALDYSIVDERDGMQCFIARNRFAFFPATNVDDDNASDKTNAAEADKVVELALAVYNLYRANKKVFDPQKTMGVIAPYRNQIALIKHKLDGCGIAELSEIMVDTVERYQGSQRDVIILSFCFNKPYQIRFFSNMNREGTVDRKLNVALTRAREQLLMVGNDVILKQNRLYGMLIGAAKVWKG